IVLACAKLGQLTCKYLHDGQPGLDEAFDLIGYIRRSVDPSNRWHITNVLLNMLMLFRDQKRALEMLLEEAKPLLNVELGTDVRDVYGENRRMATTLGLGDFGSGPRIGGRFGDLFKRTGMAFPYFFIWS